MRLDDIGTQGQRRLGRGSVLIVGCGALGCAAADALVRAGAGRVRLVDGDIVDRTNLHRQILFTEADAQQGLPKVEAAANRLMQINQDVNLDPIATDLVAENAGRLCDTVDVIVDGTDNYETRFILNDLAVQRGVPLVYGGAIGVQGAVAVILPQSDDQVPWQPDPGPTACLRCLMAQPPAGTADTCQTVGVLGPLPVMVGSAQAVEAIKLLIGRYDLAQRHLQQINPWQGGYAKVNTDTAIDPDCPCCGQRCFEYLEAKRGSASEVVCSRVAVQIWPDRNAEDASGPVDLAAIADRLEGVVPFQRTRFSLRLQVDQPGGERLMVTVFPDGRAMVTGTRDPVTARAVYRRWIGL
jgi:adenylyltransferase/sulfurtransferase